MIDLIKKTMYAGVGLAFLTKDKLDEIAKELIRKGELSEKEGREFFNEMAAKSEEVRKSLEKRVEKAVRDTISRLNLVTKDDLAALDKRITKLENEK